MPLNQFDIANATRAAMPLPNEEKKEAIESESIARDAALKRQRVQRNALDEKLDAASAYNQALSCLVTGRSKATQFCNELVEELRCITELEAADEIDRLIGNDPDPAFKAKRDAELTRHRQRAEHLRGTAIPKFVTMFRESEASLPKLKEAAKLAGAEFERPEPASAITNDKLWSR